jgi:hypothetical protein
MFHLILVQMDYSFLFLCDPKEFRHSHVSPNHARCLKREVAPQDEESEGGHDRQVHQSLFKEATDLENSPSNSRKKIRLIPVLGGMEEAGKHCDNCEHVQHVTYLGSW